ncbi:MAG: cupin domain-containing protein, partial [bacterium]|nr:cupin domain-containing protein [bacterium]
DESEYEVKDGDVVIVPEGAKHNIINTSSELPLKLYTLYCPPHHKDKTIHTDKDQALGDKEHCAGETTE